MPKRLSHIDYDRLLSCIEAIHRCRTLDDFPQIVLTELRKLIPCNLSGYNEVNLALNRILIVFDPPHVDVEKISKSFGTFLDQHPVISYVNSTGDGQALKISDFLTAREFQRLPIYRDFYKGINAKDQISISVRVEQNFIVGIAFNRENRSFTERERILLNLARPHIVQAYLNAKEFTDRLREGSDWRRVLCEAGIGVIALDSTGGVIRATPGAFDCLDGYFPAAESEGNRLPPSLAQWALEELDHDYVRPFVIRKDAAKLTFRRATHESRILLILSEEKPAANTGKLHQFQLTPRESEVLRWLGEGKSNFAIASILDLTVGTVKLHVERILAKLGVENRTEAALLVRHSSF